MDASAIEALYDSHAPSLLSLCFRYCGNRDDAEDILHDGFIKIIQHIHGFKVRSDGSLEAWMRRIMVNTSLNFLRARMKEKNWVDIYPIQEKIDAHEEENVDQEKIYLQVDQKKFENNKPKKVYGDERILKWASREEKIELINESK